MASGTVSLSSGAVEIYDEEVLGAGSYGKVCKAKCGQLLCAAKLLHPTMFQSNDPGIQKFTARFEQECGFLEAIKHPNIVQYLDRTRDAESGRPILLMELMDENLTGYLERSTCPLFYHTQLNICHDVALALAYLHSNAFVHRDLSSNNVLLVGSGVRAKITDFGMSKLMGINPQMTQCPGTVVYMPPEALTTPPHYSSKLDSFSHGVLAIQIITKNFPDPGDATSFQEDNRFPTGRVIVLIPEADRREKDINLIEADYPLLPIALDCLKDKDTERPSSEELCTRLASLKTQQRYADSVEQTRNQSLDIQRLEQELQEKGCEVAKNQEEIQRLEQELRAMLEEKQSLEAELILKDKTVKNCRDEIQRLEDVSEAKEGTIMDFVLKYRD